MLYYNIYNKLLNKRGLYYGIKFKKKVRKVDLTKGNPGLSKTYGWFRLGYQ